MGGYNEGDSRRATGNFGMRAIFYWGRSNGGDFSLGAIERGRFVVYQNLCEMFILNPPLTQHSVRAWEMQSGACQWYLRGEALEKANLPKFALNQSPSFNVYQNSLSVNRPRSIFTKNRPQTIALSRSPSVNRPRYAPPSYSHDHFIMILFLWSYWGAVTTSYK